MRRPLCLLVRALVRVVPVAKGEPRNRKDGGVKNEPEYARNGGSGEKRRIFRLRRIDHRLKPEAAAVAGRGARIHFGDYRADRSERSRNPETGEKIGQGGRDAQEKQLLTPARAIK